MSAHEDKDYVKVWAILVGLLAVSVTGPLLGIFAVTMITAFGVALVKAYLVLTRFMHVNAERKWISYLLATMLAFMVLMFAGFAPDVMKHEGHNWENVAAKQEISRRQAADKEHPPGEQHAE